MKLTVFMGLMCSILVSFAAPAHAAPTGDCSGAYGLSGVVQECVFTVEEVKEFYASATTTRYKLTPICNFENNGTCYNPLECATPPNTFRYNVLRSEEGGPFVKIGEVCLNQDELNDLKVITIQMVTRAFASLKWPSSPMTIQPPGGRTLVNLATNFSTTNTAPTSKDIRLLGQDVEIEATPVGYTWHYTTTESETTTSPGALYPDLDITHTYTDADVTEHPWLDTTYQGRYRINGGPWATIPETLTITGAPTDLQILTATPTLVGAD